MKNPKKSNYKLNKIKLVNGGGVVVKFTVQDVIGQDTYTDTDEKTSTKQPHPDLTARIKKLGRMVAQVLCFTNVIDIVNKKEFKADPLQKEYMAKYADLMTDKIRVTGFSIHGEDAKRAIIINTSFAVDNNQRTSINTPKILLSGDTRGFEEDLEILLDEISSEAFEFIYENKIENPEMFNYGDEEETPEEKPAEKVEEKPAEAPKKPSKKTDKKPAAQGDAETKYV